MKTQAELNTLACNLRKTVISNLVVRDIMACNASKPDNATLEWRCGEIYNLPVPTLYLERLFAKAREIIGEGKDNVPVCLNLLKRAVQYIEYDFGKGQGWNIQQGAIGCDTEAYNALHTAIAANRAEHSEVCLPNLRRDYSDPCGAVPALKLGAR